MRSILSYAGTPVRVFADGSWCERPGWGMTIRRAMPGLGLRWLSLAETPDLDIIPGRFAVRQAAVFRAGLEMPLLHLGLLAASLPVRWRLLPSLLPMARMFRAMAALLEPYGTDRGGMSVEATGLDGDGRVIRGVWSMVAESGDGPFVPVLPILAALQALAEGRLASPQASSCVGLLSLAEIEREFCHYRITSGLRFESLSPSLYERVLGDSFHQLPEPVRRLHQPGWRMQACGSARVDGAGSWIARLVSAIFNFPDSALHVPVKIEITATPKGERWARNFNGKRFLSILSDGPKQRRLVERFGPFFFDLDLSVSPAGVHGMAVRAWRFGRLPLPAMLAPLAIATESVDEQGRFHFDVEIRLPLGLGRLMRYQGWLVVQP